MVSTREMVDIHDSPQQNINSLYYLGLYELLDQNFLCSLSRN